MAGLWKYDLDELTGTRSGLSELKASYESATSDRKAASSAFGSDKIAGAVEEFVDSWSRTRRKQVTSIGNATTALSACIQTYEEADAQGVSGIRNIP